MEEDKISKLQITIPEDFEEKPSSSGTATEQKFKQSTDYDSENDDSDVDSELEQANEDFLNYYLLGEEAPKKSVPMEAGPSEKKKLKQKTNRQYTSKLPPHLKGLMGEANIRFARGDLETAEKMCYEVIRQYRNSYEPYLTLAQLYENLDPEKSLQYHYIAAHFRPSDADQWVHLAQKYIDINDLRQALSCFSKAIGAQPKNTWLYKQRIKVYELLGDTKAVLRCKHRLVRILPPKKYEEIIKLATEVAHQHHANKNYAKAVDVLNVPFKNFPDKVTPALVNMFLELLILTKNYSTCLDVFLEFCNIEIEIVLEEDNQIKVMSYNMPDNLPIDLRIKFIVCLVKLGSLDLVPPMINQLLQEEDVETIGDLYLDVAEALMEMKQPEEALKLLVPLVKSKKFSLPAVWLKHAECLNACGLQEQAVDSYYTVMAMAPQHVEVRRLLAELLIKLGRKEEAFTALSQDPLSHELDVGLLTKKMQVLKDLGDYKQYFDTAHTLLARHCITIRHADEMRVLTTTERPAVKLNNIRLFREFRGVPMEPGPTSYTGEELSLAEEYAIFKEIVQTCRDQEQFALFQKFCMMALSSPKFHSKRQELNLWAFIACLHNNDISNGYLIIRDMINHNLNNHLVWNMFNVFLQKADDQRYNKFMMRLIKSHTIERGLRTLLGNYGMVAGNYNYSMENYMVLFRTTQTPFLSLALGNIMLQMCFQRTTFMDKKKLTTTAIALFLHYARNRGKDAEQEVYYNMGKLYQQLGIAHLAEGYYKKVLEYRSELVDRHSEILDLKREAAFNLHLIYRLSKNDWAARNVLRKYIVI